MTDRRVTGQRSPDEWLAFLTPLGEFDRRPTMSARAAGGFFARRFAKKHDLPNGLRRSRSRCSRSSARTTTPRRRSSSGSTSPGPGRARKEKGPERPLQAGPLPQDRRHVLRRPVAGGPRAVRRRRRCPLRRDRPPPLLAQDQAQRQRQDEDQDEEQDEDRDVGHDLVPCHQLRGRLASPPRAPASARSRSSPRRPHGRAAHPRDRAGARRRPYPR